MVGAEGWWWTVVDDRYWQARGETGWRSMVVAEATNEAESSVAAVAADYSKGSSG